MDTRQAWSLESYWPGVKPTATLAGYPRARASTAMAVANCWQNPRREWVRKFRTVWMSVVPFTPWSYVKPCR